MPAGTAAHEVHRRIRRVLDAYPTFGEVWIGPVDLRTYLRPDELHFAFHFALTGAPFGPTRSARRSTPPSTARAPARPHLGAVQPRRRARVTLRKRCRRVQPGPARRPGASPCRGSRSSTTVPNSGCPATSRSHDRLTDPTWDRGHAGTLPRAAAWSGDRPPYRFSGRTTAWLPMPTPGDRRSRPSPPTPSRHCRCTGGHRIRHSGTPTTKCAGPAHLTGVWDSGEDGPVVCADQHVPSIGPLPDGTVVLSAAPLDAASTRRRTPPCGSSADDVKESTDATFGQDIVTAGRRYRPASPVRS